MFSLFLSAVFKNSCRNASTTPILWYALRLDDMNPKTLRYLMNVNETIKQVAKTNNTTPERQLTMTDEQNELFEKYTDCVREHQTITDCLIFQNGFKLGARMMLEVMEEQSNTL